VGEHVPATGTARGNSSRRARVEPEQIVEGIEEALTAARREEPWPERMQLPDAVEELSSWLEDERQWSSAHTSNWVSLMNDVISAIRVFGPEAQQATESSSLCDRLEECRAMFNSLESRLHLPWQSI